MPAKPPSVGLQRDLVRVYRFGGAASVSMSASSPASVRTAAGAPLYGHVDPHGRFEPDTGKVCRSRMSHVACRSYCGA